MKIEAGKPCVVRGMVKRTKNLARDTRTGFRVRLVRGQKQHKCEGPCPWPDQIIEAGPYLAVTHPDWNKRIGHRYVPTERKYHPDCVPPKARPLVRFLIPTPWLMTLCEDSFSKDPAKNHKSWRFTSVEAWRVAMDRHYPEMAKRWSTSFYRNAAHQVGTDNHWSLLEYKPRPFEP